MKIVIALIKPNKFNDVMLALHKIEGLTGASSSEVNGFGLDRSRNIPEHKPGISLDFKPHIRLEIACHSELVDEALATIAKAAHAGLRGDGKIYAFPLEQAVRISTGDQGEKAVQKL